MSTVRISLKAARNARASLATSAHSTEVQAFMEIDRAIAQAERSKARRAESRKPKAKEKAEKREETAAIRAAAMERSKGHCECCGAMASEMDHFFGRGKVKQAVSNCWFLCMPCHRAKTNNSPNAATWLTHFISFAEWNGYAAEAATAKSRLAFVIARGTS